MLCFHFYGNSLGKVFYSSMTVHKWLCPSAQSEVHKNTVRWAWCGRTWLACTELWPQPHRTPLRWTGADTSSQAFSSNISVWPHKCTTGWLSKILSETLQNPLEILTRKMEAIIVVKGVQHHINVHVFRMQCHWSSSWCNGQVSQYFCPNSLY